MLGVIDMIIQICVGSSCHLKDTQDIIDLFQNAIADNKLDEKITLAGSFCSGKCNHEGVTVSIDDEVYTGITKDSFKALFEDKVLKHILSERN